MFLDQNNMLFKKKSVAGFPSKREADLLKVCKKQLGVFPLSSLSEWQWYL